MPDDAPNENADQRTDPARGDKEIDAYDRTHPDEHAQEAPEEQTAEQAAEQIEREQGTSDDRASAKTGADASSDDPSA